MPQTRLALNEVFGPKVLKWVDKLQPNIAKTNLAAVVLQHQWARLADLVIKARNAETSLVDRANTEGMNVAENQHLIDARGDCIVREAVARQRGSAQAAGIWIIQVVAIVEVVDR